MKLFKYVLIALTAAQTVHLEDLGADDPFSYLDYYMDGDYYEDYQEELDYQIGARAKKKGNKNKGKYGNTQLPQGWTNIPRQKYLKRGDNRDRVADALLYLLNNAPDSGKLPSYGQLLQYGCWCQLHTQLWEGSNKGVPLDPLDAACRSWNKCYDCQTMDKKTCNGLENEYGKIAYNSHLDELACDYAAEPNTCARTACECDLQLAQSLYEYSYDFNQDYMASKGFDPAQECKASREGGQQTSLVDSCCGTSPNRFPFYSDNGKRACCNGKTFDAQNLVCCPDGPAVSC